MKDLLSLCAVASVLCFAPNTTLAQSFGRSLDVLPAQSIDRGCQRLQRQVAKLRMRLRGAKRSAFCGRRWKKVQLLRAKVALLQRSVVRTCGLVHKEVCQLETVSKQAARSCVACMDNGACGACPIQAGALRRSCRVKQRVVLASKQKVKRLGLQVTVAKGLFVRLCDMTNALLGRQSHNVAF